MIATDFQPGQLAGALRKLARELGDVSPVLRGILEDLEQLGQEYAERAQAIPLAPSTLRRKQYARSSVGRFEAGEARKAKRLAALEASQTPGARRAIAGLRKPKSRSAIARPASSARVLERVGGFLESFTPESSKFDIRTINEDAATLRFGSKLGGLWKLHGTGYSVGRENVTKVPARFPFGFSAESQQEIAELVERNQREFVEKAVG